MQHAANVQSFDFIGDKLQHTPGPHLIGGSLTADIKQNASDSPGTILWLKRHLPGLSHARTRRHGHVWLGREVSWSGFRKQCVWLKEFSHLMKT